MYKRKIKFERAKMLFAFAVLAIVALMCAIIDPVTATGFIGAIAAVPIFGAVSDGTFKEQSAEQVAEMEPDVQIKYFNELNLYRAKKISDLEKRLKTENSEEIAHQLAQLRTELNDGYNKQFGDISQNMSEMNKLINQYGIDIKNLKQNGGEQRKTLRGILAEKAKDIYDVLSKGGNASYELNISKTIAMSSIVNDPAGVIIPGFGQIQTQRNTIAASMNTFPMGPDSHGIVRYTDWTSVTRGAAARSDGAAAGVSNGTLTGFNESLRNISDSIPVHLEALRDVSLMEAELRNLLQINMAVKEDNLLWNGTGVSPQIKGLYTYASAFDAAAYIGNGGFTPDNPSIYDLVVAMAAYIMRDTMYNVDRVYINPLDTLRLKLAKDKNGQWLFPTFFVQQLGAPKVIDNMVVIESNSVTPNTLAVADSRFLRRYIGEDVNITMGYNASGDFTKRIITLLANQAELLVIRNAEQDSLLKSTDITNDVAAIEAPVA